VGIKEWVIPQDKVFFDLFEELAANVKLAAEHLVYLVENYEDVKNQCHKMKQIEHKGDEITHSIYQLLNKTFITPIEPEEISRLATALDDILDYIDGTTRQMYFYSIENTDEYMVELAHLILKSTKEVEVAVADIREIKSPNRIEERCIEINRLENLADDVLGHALQDVFKRDSAIEIIKFKDIYENLECATDKCEDAANVLSDIAIRHS